MANDYLRICDELKASPKNWLVTGAAGFIGSHLVERLLKLNQNVIGIDNFSTGSQQNITQLALINSGQFILHEMDIQSSDVKKIFTGIDYVLHHAAMVSVPESIIRPEVTHDINITGFLNILRAAQATGVKRFVYASSSAVYGNVEAIPVAEETVDLQVSPYGLSKYVNELYAKTLSLSHDLSTIGLRYFNVFGPRQDPNGAYAAVIPRWITALVNHARIQIFGDGETTRDFCYINNIVQANILAATTTNPDAMNQVFNIATGQEISLNELYRVLKQNLSLVEQEPEYIDFRPGDIRRSVANITKAKTLLGYQPTYDLHRGLAEAMSWYKLNS